MPRVLLVISADFPRTSEENTGPRKDFVALARRLDAAVLDPASLRRSRSSRLALRLLGAPAALAWAAFQRRHDFDAIFTDGEHIGIPLALMLKLVHARVPHITIGHRLSASKKRPFFCQLKVHERISRIVLHSRRQIELATELGIPKDRLAFVPYQVDTDYWRPLPVPEERLICSVGREHRDYPTLFRAVDGIDARVVIGAASHWSRCQDSALQAQRPANVEIGSFDYSALRDLYARAAVVVVPLQDVDNQSGVTTILEAMAMGKAVIVTHSEGQTDVVEDRRAVTRGDVPRSRPASLLRTLAEELDEPVEPNGFYVAPGDADSLRRSIVYLLNHPEDRRRLGAAGRRLAERLLRVDQFADRMAKLIEQECSSKSGPGSDQLVDRTEVANVHG